MTTAGPPLPPVQRPMLMLALVLSTAIEIWLIGIGTKTAILFPVGLLLGLSLYHAAFGFTSAYRRAFRDRDISGVAAQIVMLALAMVLFAPVLAEGSAFGHRVGGAVAPVGYSMMLGAFLFGIGMQLAGGCGSGTLYTAGGGSPRMVLVLVFFCVGGFWGSLDLPFWWQFPEMKRISLAGLMGWPGAVALQLVLLAAIYAALRALGGRVDQPLWWPDGISGRDLLRGPWPLLLSAGLLALLNFTTLLVAGHPWSITWAFALWPAKAAAALGWDPATNAFWTGGFQERALGRSVFLDVTSVMNFGIMLGAFAAAALAGRIQPTLRIGWRSALAAVIGGLMLGYGARLAYGCNIGAFFSGVASTSLHGWAWIVAALAGNWLGVKLRPLFGFAD